MLTLVCLQMTGKDKDYRYMATSDLLNELSKEGFKADTDLEAKVVNTVLHQLEDAAGDVSGLAVKWFVSCFPLEKCNQLEGVFFSIENVFQDYHVDL